MSKELDTARADVAHLEKELERLAGQSTDLDARRAEVQVTIRKTRREITAAQTRVRELSDAPAAEKELERIVTELEAKLSKASATSPTANTLRRRLGGLRKLPLSTAAKTAIAKDMLKDASPERIYQRDRIHWDNKIPPMPGREPR